MADRTRLGLKRHFLFNTFHNIMCRRSKKTVILNMKHKGGDQKSAKKCQVSFEWYISIGKSKLKLTSGINLFHQIKCEFLSLVIPSKYRRL